MSKLLGTGEITAVTFDGVLADPDEDGEHGLAFDPGTYVVVRMDQDDLRIGKFPVEVRVLTPADTEARPVSHKTDAEYDLAELESGPGSDNFHINTGELKSDALALAQIKATLALVEAQEAANELKRIEVLHAIATDATNRFGNYAGVAGLFATIFENPQSEHGNIGVKPHIAAALGIGGAE